jgi:hypothetical protein
MIILTCFLSFFTAPIPVWYVWRSSGRVCLCIFQFFRRRDEECLLSTLGTSGCGCQWLDGDGQVSSGSASLPDPVALETEERTLVNIQTVKGLFIAHTFCTGWSVGVVKSGKAAECLWPVYSHVVSISQKRITGLKKLNKEDYGVDKYWTLLAVVKE